MSNIVPIRPTSLFRALDKLADDADQLREQHVELRDAVWKQADALKDSKPVDIKLLADKKAAALSQYDAELLAQCREELDILDPAENYEDNDRQYGDLRRGVIKVRL